MKYALLAVFLVALLWAAPASAVIEAGIDVNMHTSSLCPCSTLAAEDFDVLVTNLDARPQVYNLELVLPDDELWSGFIVPYANLSGNEMKKAAAFITPSCWAKPGMYTIAVRAVSEESGKVTEKTFDVEVLKCKWVEASVAEQDTCQGKESRFDIEFTNEGDSDEKVRLLPSEDWVSFSTDEFSIANGEKKTVEAAVIPPDGLEGSKDITVEVQSEISYMRNRFTIPLKVSKCYGTELTVSPESAQVCPCRSAEFMLVIKNTGLMEDEYTINYGGQSSSMLIGSGETGNASLTIEVPCDKEAGEYPLDVSVDANEPASSSFIVEVLPQKTCYDLYLYSDDAVNVKAVKVGESETYALVLFNRGKFSESYRISLDGPSWTHLSEHEAELAPGEKTEFYIYAAPEFETQAGSYPVTVTASAEHESTSLQFEIVAVSNFTVTESTDESVQEAAADNESNETSEYHQDIPTAGNVVGSGGFGDSWTQIAMISLLGMIVVVILVIRFVFLIR